LQLLGIHISPPEPDPQSWAQLCDRCMYGVLPVRQWVQERGVLETKLLGQVQTACAGALLTELLRDVRLEMIEHDRLYLPADVASKHGLDIPLLRKAIKLDTDRGCDGDLRDSSCDCALMPRGDMLALRKPYRATMRDLVNRTQGLFAESESSWRALPPELSRPLHAQVLEARSTLKMIARHDYDTLTRRPKLGAFPRVWNHLRLRLG